MINISVGEYQIRRDLAGQTFITKKGVVKATFINNPPSASEINNMSFTTAHAKMQIAFETGKWPSDPCPRCGK